MAGSRPRLRRLLHGAAVAAVTVAVAVGLTATYGWAVEGEGADDLDVSDLSTEELVLLGRDVYGARCATCHGASGRGEGGFPPLLDSGPADVDFYMRTGRMPLRDADEPVRHREQRVTDLERLALVAYVPTLGEDDGGSPIPDVSGWEQGDLGRGLELFTTNCVACHGPTAAGVAVGQQEVSSNLEVSSPLEIAEAVRVGPGVMPVFGEELIPQEDLDAIVAWVMNLRERESPGGINMGRSGPVSEGFIAWVVGMGGLLGIMYLLGEKRGDRPHVEAPARTEGSGDE